MWRRCWWWWKSRLPFEGHILQSSLDGDDDGWWWWKWIERKCRLRGKFATFSFFLSLSRCFVHIFVALVQLVRWIVCKQVILLCLNDSKQASRSNSPLPLCSSCSAIFFSALVALVRAAPRICLGEHTLGLLFSLPAKERGIGGTVFPLAIVCIACRNFLLLPIAIAVAVFFTRMRFESLLTYYIWRGRFGRRNR